MSRIRWGSGATTHDLLDTLQRLGPCPARAIVEDTGRHQGTVQSTLTRLVGRGLVRWAKDERRCRVYSITKAGRAWLGM